MSEAKRELGYAQDDYNKVYQEYMDQTENALKELKKAEAAKKASEAKHVKAQGEIDKLKEAQAALKDREIWEAARTALDVTGIAEPTPFSDLASAGISIGLGDYGEAALSLISCVPYVGDFFGKGGKIFKKWVTASTGELLAEVAKKLEKATGVLNTAKKAFDDAGRVADKALDAWKNSRVGSIAAKARDEAIKKQQEVAARVRQKLLNEANPKYANCKYGTQVARSGKWEGEIGNSLWKNADETTQIRFKEGYPDFSHPDTKICNSNGEFVSPVYKDQKTGVDGTVDIIQKGADNHDFRLADEAMARKLGQETFRRPDNYTWHHEPNGTGMTLVDQAAHNKAAGGAAHTGGRSIVKSDKF